MNKLALKTHAHKHSMISNFLQNTPSFDGHVMDLALYNVMQYGILYFDSKVQI